MNKNFSVFIVLVALIVVGWLLFRNDSLPFVNNNQTNTPVVTEPQDNDDEVSPGSATASGGCYIGGCSSQICSDQPDAVSTCEFREEYACYRTAKCERQTNGQCGWTQTTALTMCLDASLEL
jgi:hypothetical protein